MDDFDKWVKAIITILTAVIIWAVFMMTLLTFRKLGGGNVMDTIFLIIFGIWALALIIVIAVATWEGLL